MSVQETATQTIQTPPKRSRKKRVLRAVLHVFCAVLVMGAAVFVRIPSATLLEAGEASKEIYFSDSGLPYLTDLDSYYHVRLVQNDLNNDMLGDSRTEDGAAWDSLRFYPEGQSADYPPAIVYVTEAVWRLRSLLGNPSLEATEFSLPALMAALTALVAYMGGCRLGGLGGGLLSGLLVGCGPLFTARTIYGRFDTDMFTVFMELLLVLFLTEALKASSPRKRWAFAGAFALTVAAFGGSWMPKYSMLFAGLTLAGGLLYIVLRTLLTNWRLPLGQRVRRMLTRPDTVTWLGAGLLTLLVMVIVAGPSSIGQVLSALSFTSGQRAGEGVLPSLFVSVSELKGAKLLPDSLMAFFLGYVPNKAPSAVNGVGGGIAVLMALGGLVRLGLLTIRRFRRGKEGLPSRSACLLYLCVLGAWFAAGLYLIRSGIRFIYHLSVSVSMLAAFDLREVSRSLRSLFTKLAAKRVQQPKGVGIRILSACLVALLFLAAALPAVSGALLTSTDSRPTVSDASANAMAWVKQNVKNTDAVLASWWDMGYYYEYASGHPCLWDGGAQDSVRAILVSKALTADNLALSYRILQMLAGSGNRAVELLMEHLDPKTAFAALWKALLMNSDGTERLLTDCGLSAEAAARAEALIHPAQKQDVYLVLTYTMTRQMGWYEYFANWDFTGAQRAPASTWYSRTPGGTSVFDDGEGQEYLENVRSKETLWRLFFNAETSKLFTPVYEWHDGQEHIRIWRVEG